MPWKSGWCGSGSCERCVGYGPSASKKDGRVDCSCTCHQKRQRAAKEQWKGLK